jgi:hypothetical protein
MGETRTGFFIATGPLIVGSTVNLLAFSQILFWTLEKLLNMISQYVFINNLWLVLIDDP